MTSGLRNRVQTALVASLIIIIVVFFASYTLRDEIELIDSIQSGYHLGITRNTTKVLNTRRNATLYTARFAKERKARAEIKWAKDRIFSEWAIRQYPLFLTAVYIPSQSWHILKNYFMSMMVKLESENKQKFVIGFAGSGVTLGVDNYPNQSYPALIKRNLDPIFTSLQIKLEVFGSTG